jgi:hypothetical protein
MIVDQNQHFCLLDHDRKERITAHNLLQGAADGLASCILASSSIVCRGFGDAGIGQSHPVRLTERITSEMP